MKNKGTVWFENSNNPSIHMLGTTFPSTFSQRFNDILGPGSLDLESVYVGFHTEMKGIGIPIKHARRHALRNALPGQTCRCRSAARYACCKIG